MTAYLPPPGASPVVFADDWLIIAEKPCGLLSVPGRGEHKADCLLSRVQQEYPDALTVHRLDMSTSGILVSPAVRRCTAGCRRCSRTAR
jgi:tRNA pseudouridine32 synthase/23S rRNA pseudouridine746 synthase